MIVRRVPMLAISLVMAVALALVARDDVAPVQAVFSNVSTPWMPSAPLPGGLTSTWMCPGVPADGEQGLGGVVRVFNTGDSTMGGRITVLTASGDPVTQPVSVAAFSFQDFDLDALVDSPYAAAVVEIDGGGGLVEQRALHDAGHSVAACANNTSSEWYLATGDTVDGSVEQLVLSNPHDDDAIVDVVLSTSRGPRTPAQLKNFAVPARSVRVINVNEHAPVNEANVGISVIASRGGVVAGRAQTFSNADRTGYVMTLAAPALNDQWWFAYGVKDPDVTVTYSLYNPNEFDVEVTPVLLGFAPGEDFAQPESIPVAGGEVVAFALNDVTGIPDGLVSAVFGTNSPDETILVERTVTRTIEGIRTTSVSIGAPPRPADGYVANTWYVGLGAAEATEDGLVIWNIDAADAVVTVQAITPQGLQNVESLVEVALPGSQTISIDLTADMVLQGYPLIIRSTSRVFVERVLRREDGAQGRVAVWAVPANA